MSLQSVRNFLAERAPDIEIVELDRSSETKTIATAWNVKPAQIAKTLSLCVGERNVLLVTCGNSRLDNQEDQSGSRSEGHNASSESGGGDNGTPGWRCLPLWSCHAVTDLLRRLAQEFRHRRARRWLNAQRDAHRSLRMAALAEAEWVDVCENAR